MRRARSELPLRAAGRRRRRSRRRSAGGVAQTSCALLEWNARRLDTLPLEHTHECERTRGEEHEEAEEREIFAGPVDAGAFAGPERSECRKHEPDRELERVLRNSRERCVQEQPCCDDEEKRGSGRSRRQWN